MTQNGGSIVWFRNDLRLADNPALQAAVYHGGPIIPLYVWAPEEEGDWPAGAASRWWLHHSLARLDESLRQLGSRLIIQHGASWETIRSLVQTTRSTAVYWNRRYEPLAIRRDTQIKSGLSELGVAAENFNGSLLFEPWRVLTRQARPFQVFTPYWKTCLSLPAPERPVGIPMDLESPEKWPSALSLDELRLLPTVDWASGLRSVWRPGEAGACELLRRFLEDSLPEYPLERNRPDHCGTSRLSPHLHFGEISAREVWAGVQAAIECNRTARAVEAARVYASELGWREFAHYLLFHFPDTPRTPLLEQFTRFPWRHDAERFRAWKRGRTGFPIVDAGMRELWHTGWMHNRVRMIVASFLVKDVLIPWQDGAKWFWDTLVDADLANNTLGWQWTAGCGADAAPYFRIFNPVLQGEKFDPEGDYVRRWIPELAKLPATWIHAPWKAPPIIA